MVHIMSRVKILLAPIFHGWIFNNINEALSLNKMSSHESSKVQDYFRVMENGMDFDD